MRQSCPLRIGSVPCRRARGRARERERMRCRAWSGRVYSRREARRRNPAMYVTARWVVVVAGGKLVGSVATPESLCLLSRLRVGRQYSNGHADAGSNVRDDTRQVGRDREGCARFQDAAALDGLERKYSRRKGGRADDRKGDREVFWGGSLTLRRLRPSSRRATDWGPQRRLNLGLGCQSCLLPQMPRKCAHPPRARHCVLPALENLHPHPPAHHQNSRRSGRAAHWEPQPVRWTVQQRGRR